jgi:hypothetical protein
VNIALSLMPILCVRLTHDIALDNADAPLDDAEENFPAFETSNKENDSTLTTSKWTSTSRSPMSLKCQQQLAQKTSVDLLKGDRLLNNSSPTTVGLSNLLEVRNQLNAAKSKFNSREETCVTGMTLLDSRRTGGMDLTSEYEKNVKSESTTLHNGNGGDRSTNETCCWRIEDFATSGKECAKSGLNSFTKSGMKRVDDSSIVRRTEDRKPSTGSSSTYTRMEDARIPVRFIQVTFLTF